VKGEHTFEDSIEEVKKVTEYYHEPFWRIAQTEGGKLAVVERTLHDELERDLTLVAKDAGGEPLAFPSKEDALRYLNKHFKPEYIDPESVYVFDAARK